MGCRLSDADKQRIRELYAGGLPHSEIANEVGCSRGHVCKVANPEAARRYKANEKKRQCRPWTSEEVERAVDLRNQGWGDNRIARALNRTVGSVEGQLAFRRDDGSRIKPHKVGAPPSIPDWVLADRDRRMALNYASLTARVMGDPLR